MSVKLYASLLPPPEANYHIMGVSQNTLSGIVEIQPTTSSSGAGLRSPDSGSGVMIRTSSFSEQVSAGDIPFFALPPSYLGNHIKSYGGYLRYRLRYRGTAAQVNGPDIMISVRRVTEFSCSVDMIMTWLIYNV